MAIEKKLVRYETTNSYETLNQVTGNTKHTWLVCHGMGYLSRYFLKHFGVLDPKTNYIIAPQAPSKYYLKDDFRHVGASWLTKVDTQTEVGNIIRYLNAVKTAEQLTPDRRLILFGFSQGVSIVMRWLVQSQVVCSKLVLYAGGIPNEIAKEDLEFIDYRKTEVLVIYGNKDNYLNEERLASEQAKINYLFAGNAKIIHFEGGHEIKGDILKEIATT